MSKIETRTTQGPFIQVMRLQPQTLVICRIWVNCLYCGTFDAQDDGHVYRAQRCLSRELFDKNILFLIISSLIGERASQAKS